MSLLIVPNCFHSPSVDNENQEIMFAQVHMLYNNLLITFMFNVMSASALSTCILFELWLLMFSLYVPVIICY